MKKLCMAVLVFFLALGVLVTPASAKGEPLLEANVQSSVYQGRTEVLWFRAINQAPKGSQKVDWRIVLPKSVFPNRPEVVTGNPMMVMDLGSEWGYVWKATLKPGKSSVVELRVGYSSTAAGTFQSAEVRGPGRKIVVLATFQTEILKARLQPWFSAQFDRDNTNEFVLDTLGDKDITVDLQIGNPAGPQSYDVSVVFDFACVTVFSVSNDPGTVYEEDVPGDGFHYSSWAGTLGQDEVATWQFLMKSTSFDCSGSLFRLIDKASGEVLLDVSILVDGKTQELIWMFEIPGEVIQGSTFTGTFSVQNRTGEHKMLNVNTHFAMYCSLNFELLSYPQDALAGHYFDGLFHQYSWNNYLIAPDEVLTWVFQETAVDTVCGNSVDRMFELMDNTTGTPVYYQAILVK